MAARLIRRVLVDFARARNNQKRGGLLNRVTLDENLPVASDAPEDLIAIDNALRSLAAQYERKSQVVELAFLRWAECRRNRGSAENLPQTVMTDWKFAENRPLRQLSRTSTGR
jgi:hypothetical protein